MMSTLIESPEPPRLPRETTVACARRKARAATKDVAVVPFARALGMLNAFTAEDQWLGNGDLAARTGLPASTVSRIAQSLVSLGYLHHEQRSRKYCLAASVLALGYAAVADSDVQKVARPHMQAFAREHQTDVCLCSRDRLDMVVLETCRPQAASTGLNLRYGVRVRVEASPSGWALLASLPEHERYYLLEQAERQQPRDWQRQRRRSAEAIRQVRELGFCSSAALGDPTISVVAAPLVVVAQGPLVLACLGSSLRMSRARVERELGPKLIAMTQIIHQEVLVQ